MKHFRIPFLLLVVLLMIVSCQLIPDSETPDKQPKQLAPDNISESLVLKDATKIVGELPTAPDGGIKMEVRDSIFSVKGFALGNRIQFQKDPIQDVSGYFIGIPGSSFYFDVPEENTEGEYIAEGEEDTSSVIVLDLDLDTDEVDYPYTVEIIIQPHDPSGTPLDEFERTITIEEPQNLSGGGNCNNITRPVGDNRIHWEWEFTIREFNGEVLNVFGPGLATRINSQGSGCCDNQGRSWTTSNNPACVPNTTATHMNWIQLEVRDYSVRTFELWQIYEDGSVNVFGNYIKKQYNRATTDFCSETVGYTFENEDTGGTGTHDFQPGGRDIRFDFSDWTGSWRPRGGALIYTCHTMIISWGAEDKFSAVYKKFLYDHNPIDFYSQWKPWFD